MNNNSINLTTFDPIVFLEIDKKYTLNSEDYEKIKKQLMNDIGEFIFLQISQDLSDKQIDEILNVSAGEEKLAFLNKFVPDFQNRLQNELQNFKKEFFQQQI